MKRMLFCFYNKRYGTEGIVVLGTNNFKEEVFSIRIAVLIEAVDFLNKSIQLIYKGIMVRN